MGTPTRDMPEGLPSQESWDVAIALGRLDGLRRACQQRAHLGAADQRLMWLLSNENALTLREIADALGLEQSTVNRQVNTALDEGLLRRYREPGRSAYLVTATADGQRRFRHDLDLSVGAYHDALTHLSTKDRDLLVKVLPRFVEAYGRTIDTLDGVSDEVADQSA